MHILITNDDGIYAPGIQKLVEALKDIGRITVVAPDKERSATSHAITMHSPIMTKTIHRFGPEVCAYSVSGTPADCIKLSLDMIMKDDWPDIVVSGINNGPNLGTDVIYSGTVSAAAEASMMGVPSIAISMSSHHFTSFTDASEFVGKLVPYVLELPRKTAPMFNINFPVCNTEDIMGIKITKLGIRRYRNNYTRRKDPRGNTYYWMAGELETILQESNSDITAIDENYISVTPLNFDFTHYSVMNQMIEWKKALKNFSYPSHHD